MKQFLTSLYIFIKLYLMGYSWSGLFDSSGGFYRLNYLKGGQKEYAIIDIDFSDDENFRTFSHIHGGASNVTIFRIDDNQITHSSKPELFKQEIENDYAI
jgi:hypothetical protein